MQHVDDGEERRACGRRVAHAARNQAAAVQDRADEVAGDLVLRHVRRSRRPSGRADVVRFAAEPVSTSTRVPVQLVADRLASPRSRPARASRCPSGRRPAASSRASSTRLWPFAARPTTSIRPSVERIASSASAKRRWSSAIRTRTRSRPHASTVTRDGRGGSPREDPEAAPDRRQPAQAGRRRRRRCGESYEQALAVAREHGLEERVRPLVEIRLADLERLAGGSPPPAPPDA